MHSEKPWYEKECKDADEFLKAIGPLNTELWGDIPDYYFFRGHANSEWDLAPSAFRLPEDHYFYRSTSVNNNGNDSDDRKQIYSEIAGLRNYIIAVDAQGIQLPGNSLAFRSKWIQEVDVGQRPGGVQEIIADLTIWPPAEVLPALGLAQHYGIPTRLLDWTRNPYAAAYFAAREAAPWARWPHQYDKKRPKSLCVWALSENNIRWDGAIGYPLEWRKILAVSMPNALNPNKTAQQGIFTFSRPKRGVPAHNESALYTGKECLTELVFDAFERFYGIESLKKPKNVLTRITLPFSQSIRLLKRLGHLGYDAGSLFPGLQGAAWKVKERAIYARPMSTETGHSTSSVAVYLNHEHKKTKDIQIGLESLPGIERVRIEEVPKQPITLKAILTLKEGFSSQHCEHTLKTKLEDIDGINRCDFDYDYYDRSLGSDA